MELEADLGIDSIKRVEILSALKKRVPGLVTATAQETASMRSLEQIIAFTEKKSPQLSPQPQSALLN
jgi:acyl carrier protein